MVFPLYYGFNEGESGLVFLPSGIGMGLGIVIFGAASDRLVKSKMDAGNGSHRPEIRLTPWFTIPAGITIPIGLFIYGWTIYYHTHWIVPMIGLVIFAFGLMGVMVCRWSLLQLELKSQLTEIY